MGTAARRDRKFSDPPAESARLQRQTMAGQVAGELRRRILSGDIGEGVQLRQEQLAAEFGISKVPVREALHQLEAEGFVIQQFHRGAVVAGLSPDEIAEVSELRAQIEIWLLDLGMTAATPADVAVAREQGDLFGTTEELSMYPELNWRFHEALYRPSQKLFAIGHVKKLYSQIERYFRVQFSLALHKDQMIREHAELLRLYAAKDVRAKDCLGAHIIGSARLLTARLIELNAKRLNKAS